MAKTQSEKPVTKAPPQQQQPDPASRQTEAHMLALGKHVMETLGQPSDLYGVRVKRLWQDHYRVNVVVGGDAASVKVADSFFLRTDTDGNILACNPPITKRYNQEAEGPGAAPVDIRVH